MSKHNSELSDLLKQDLQEEENEEEEISAINLNHVDPALQFYSKHTAQIEVSFHESVQNSFLNIPDYIVRNFEIVIAEKP